MLISGGAVLPTDQTTLRDSYNLTSAQFDSDMSMLKGQNEKYMMDLITDSIILRAEYLDAPLPDPLVLRRNIEKIYMNDSLVGKELRESISQNPDIIKYQYFPVESDSYKNTSDLSTTSVVITALYENRNDSGNIEAKLAANIIADQVTEKLFGQGDNRGKDGHMVREACQEAIQNFLKENTAVSVHEFISSKNLPELVDELAIDIQKKTKYTTLGLASGGIYLPEGAITKESITSMTKKMNNSYLFSKAELEQIHEMTKDIAKNLFQGGEEGRRKEDTKLIFESLKDVILEIKKECGGAEVTDILKEKREELVGKVDVGYFSTARTGLTEKYYQATSYTTVGLASGGVYLDSEKSKKSSFVSTVKEFVVTLIGDDLSNQGKSLQALKSNKSKSIKGMVDEVISRDIEEHVSSSKGVKSLLRKSRVTSKSQIEI